MFIKRNISHLQQGSGTSCTIEHLKSLLGEAGFTTFGDEVLLGMIVNLNKINTSNNQRMFFQTTQEAI